MKKKSKEKNVIILILIVVAIIFLSNPGNVTKENEQQDTSRAANTTVRSVGAIYHSKDFVINNMKAACSQHTNYCDYEVIGKSTLGKDIYLFKIGNPDGGRLLMDGATHGWEDSGTEMMMNLTNWLLTSSETRAKNILDRTYLLFIPIVNIDSTDRFTMRRTIPNGTSICCGVDINRNYCSGFGSSGTNIYTTGWPNCYRGPFCASEPETQAVRNAMQTYKPDVYVNWHLGGGTRWNACGSNNTLYQKIITNYESYYQTSMGLKYGTGYSTGCSGGQAVADGVAVGKAQLSFLTESEETATIPADPSIIIKENYPIVLAIIDGISRETAIINNTNNTPIINTTPGSITFTETNKVISNPGIGIVSFHSPSNYVLNGYAINTTVMYYRWYWRELEPTEGQYDFSRIDSAINSAKSNNKKLVFRIMTADSSTTGIPSWLISKVNGTYNGNAFIPDFNNPNYLLYGEKLMKALGDRYGNNPIIDAVDIGMVGLWGEWHVSGTSATMPTEENKNKIVDWHFRYFSQKKLALIDGYPSQVFAYELNKGAGWRADCLGDYKGYAWGSNDPWNHHDYMYTGGITKTPGASEQWKKEPVQFETCWDPCWWYTNNYDLQTIIDFSLKYHMSVLNIKEPGTKCSLPTAWRSGFDEWQKKMGYRIWPSTINYGINANSLTITTNWKNTGVAPIYNEATITYKLSNSQKELSINSNYDLRNLMPGATTETQTLSVSSLPEGTYDLSINIKEKLTNQTIRLAIDKEDNNGWYKLGTITKTSSSNQNICNSDAKQCSDGSYVTRDSNNNCEWKTCPSETNPDKTFDIWNWIKEQWSTTNGKLIIGGIGILIIYLLIKVRRRK